MISNKDLASFNQFEEVHVNEEALQALGGTSSVIAKIGTSIENGLTKEKVSKMREMYGANVVPQPQAKTFLELFMESFEDTTLLILIGSAVVSLAVGLYEDPSTGYIEGSAILVAVLLVAIVTSSNNYSKELQFRKLNACSDNTLVTVKRGGSVDRILVSDVVVGDIVQLNAGDKIPADGILIASSDVECDESALTGESELRMKSAVGESTDRFMLSGTVMASGFATMMVTSVGQNSRWGIIRSKLTAGDTEPTPLQEKLDVLAGQIGYLGMFSATITFITLIVVWYLMPSKRSDGVNLALNALVASLDGDSPSLSQSLKVIFLNRDFGKYVLKAFIMAVTIVVVAVPEGLPLAVTLSLAFSTQKMMKDNNLIRVLEACETMGNATTICSDKTGTLTQNKMTAVRGYVFDEAFDVTESSLQRLGKACINALMENIAINSTAELVMSSNNSKDGSKTFKVTGNATEGALLTMLKDSLGTDYRALRGDSNLGLDLSRGDKLLTLNSTRKRMSIMLNRPSGPVVYSKGAPEVILERCKYYLDHNTNEVRDLNDSHRRRILEVVHEMAEQTLRTIALAHKTYGSSSRRSTRSTRSSGVVAADLSQDDIESDLVFDGMFGIKDPLRPEVPPAVKQCQAAGIMVRMVTGDNVETAKAIAKECGILTDDGLAMEGPTFRQLTPAQLDVILPKLQVLARSSPEDKLLLVSRLNGHGLPEDADSWSQRHPDGSWERDRDRLLPGYAEEWQRAHDGGFAEVVGVTGDGTNDGPALKAADVGLAMGLSGTDVAKEASDIVILDDNFASLVRAVVWGRCVFDNIQKFLQFQLTVNVVALAVTLISAVRGDSPPLNAVMMLWVNLIMDTLGALALGTEPPVATRLLNRLPYTRGASLISSSMIRNILVQSIFQLGMLYYLQSPNGASDLHTEFGSRQHNTLVFNIFVLFQVFNEINARSIDNHVNVFAGIFKNISFIMILIFTVVMQYALVTYGGDFVKTSPLTQQQWHMSFVLASLTIPIGFFMRFLPTLSFNSNRDFVKLTPLMSGIRERAMEYFKTHEVKQSKNDGDDHGSVLSWLLYLGCAAASPAIVLSFFPHYQDIVMELVTKQLFKDCQN